MGTGDIDSRSNHTFKKALHVLEVEVVHVEGEVCGRRVERRTS